MKRRNRARIVRNRCVSVCGYRVGYLGLERAAIGAESFGIVVCRVVGTVSDILGLVWHSFRPTSGLKSQTSGRISGGIRDLWWHGRGGYIRPRPLSMKGVPSSTLLEGAGVRSSTPAGVRSSTHAGRVSSTPAGRGGSALYIPAHRLESLLRRVPSWPCGFGATPTQTPVNLDPSERSFQPT